MASVNSPIRKIVKPFLFKLLGTRGYKYIQCKAKMRDIQFRLVEEKEMVLLDEFLKEGDDVIDLGANYAYYVERLSKIVGESGHVFAFEPIPFTHDVCKMMIKKLHITNTTLFPFAAGAKDETLEFRVPKLDFGAISAGQSHLAKRDNELEGKENYYTFNQADIVQCECKNVDELLLDKLKKLSFIKIDIEGAEYSALQGLKKIINKFQPAILVEIQPFFLKGMGILEKDLITLIKVELDYSIYHYDQSINKLKKVETDLWDDNYLLLSNKNLSAYANLIATNNAE